MNAEVVACKICSRYPRDVKVGQCDPALEPVLYLLGLNLGEYPADKREFVDCGHFTCKMSGVPAALEALKSGNFRVYYVGKDRIPVKAIAFGTIDKPTQNGERIVTETGDVYAYQKGYYLFTGVNVKAGK